MTGLLSFAFLACALSSLVTAQLGRWREDGLKDATACPWGSKTANASNQWQDVPDTGVTRYYTFAVTRQTISPDGVSKSALVVNGQYPGPLIEANWGDWIEVNLINHLSDPEEGTALHWHGINQQGTQWFDGTPTVSMCPVPPGSNMTYRFQAGEYGTTWYHAHYSAQYVDGIVGPIVIHGPSDNQDYDVDLGPIILTDWFHDSYEDLVAQTLAPNLQIPGFLPISDINLINGTGTYPCANVTDGGSCTGGANFTTTFTSGTKYLMRFINTGATAFFTVSLDDHEFTVVANDFTPVVPYTTETITLGIGQRTDVIVEATGAANSAYFLRVWNSPFCGDSGIPLSTGIVLYEGAAADTIPTSTGPAPPTSTLCENDPLSQTVPLYAQPASSNPDYVLEVIVSLQPNSTTNLHWVMNNVSYEGDFNAPVLEAVVANPSAPIPPERNVYNTGDNSTVRVILYNLIPAPHPMHMHGHEMRVLASGFGAVGSWDGTITNPSNPQRRDVQMLPGGANASDPSIGASYIVLEWDQDNPGVWPFHCHIAWHLTSGMSVLFLERPDEVAGLQIDQRVLDTCTNWDNWTAGNVVDTIDDGLKRKRGEDLGNWVKRKADAEVGLEDERMRLRREVKRYQ